MGAFLHTESHDGNPEGLRHAHLGRVLRGSVPASGRLPNPKDATPKENCPFCEGHEAMTPPEVEPPKRLVDTFEYEGMPGPILVETAVSEAIPGRRKRRRRSLFDNAEHLEAMPAPGRGS